MLCTHNICEVHKEQFDETWMEELASGVNASGPTQNTLTNSNAESIRTALCNYINSEEGYIQRLLCICKQHAIVPRSSKLISSCRIGVLVID